MHSEHIKTENKKNTTLSEKFQNLIKISQKTQAKSIPPTHICMTDYFPGLSHAIQ